MNARSASASYDVVIAGGGMVGTTLACALGGSNLKVAVVEPQPPPAAPGTQYDVRVSALTLAAHAVLEAVGAWPGIARRRYAPVAAMRVWEASVPSPSFPLPQAGEGSFIRSEPSARSRDSIYLGEIHFDAAEIGEPCLAYIAENSVIVAALYERLQHYPNLHWVGGAIADLALGEAAEAELDDGRRLTARLVVAADGADSGIRRRLAIPMRRLDMRQQGIVATVRTERPHEDTAWQAFLPTGPLAFLPLPEPDAGSIVWSADRARAEELLALDDAGFGAELAAAFGARLGAIRAVGPRAAFPLALAHADRYVTERVALVGDAAHTVHPLAGQGVNLGLLDAAALAEVLLAAARERRDVGAPPVLRRYERWRKGDNLAMIAVTGGFKYLFGNNWPIVRELRGAGLSLTNAIAPIKHLIMRRACGLVGDLPRLARRPPPAQAAN